MGARAEAVAGTRAQIIDAAKELHAEFGVVITSWDQIAERAGVATATVYRHFPTLAELIPACARSVFDIIQPPTLDEAAGKFAALGSPAARLEQLVRDSCACYGKGAAWLHAAYRERDFVPALDDALRVIEGSLAVLVDAASGAPLDRRDHDLLCVLCGFPMWWALAARGREHDSIAAELVRLVHTVSARITG